MENELLITNNTEKQRFEAPIGEEFAYVEYRLHMGDIVLMHTFVPDAGRGKGISSQLARFVLEYIKNSGQTMRVYCPFILSYLERHPEYKSLIRSSI